MKVLSQENRELSAFKDLKRDRRCGAARSEKGSPGSLDHWKVSCKKLMLGKVAYLKGDHKVISLIV